MIIKIPTTELCVYFTIWIFINLYALFKLVNSQSDILGRNDYLKSSLNDLEPGWKLFSRLKDVSDIEWSSWKFYYHIDNMELVRKLPTIALCGGGLWMGLQFHLKYVISYGTTAAFARLDNIEAPPTPRCIARIHVYSQMWRHFDVGLYRFLVRYIYKPSFSIISSYIKLPNIFYKLAASLGTFLFIFMWHGTVWHIFMWSFLNYIGITLEHFGKSISKHNKYIWFKENVLKTEAMETRLIAALCAPLLALSAISNFYLFAGTKVGNLFFETILQVPTFENCILLCVSLYSCCHVSMALEDVPSRKFLKNLGKEHSL
ncbi:unnamed protein product [Leptosia nina]|uniref:Protein-cysteine N-palmitoyltransferase Rasp n=1 Tax=Leptosia nina TaxID=320188 RepID=A0AAV1IT17_9NEOP